jgi:hypothetical protein
LGRSNKSSRALGKGLFSIGETSRSVFTNQHRMETFSSSGFFWFNGQVFTICKIQIAVVL